jgi:hypothetical protein
MINDENFTNLLNGHEIFPEDLPKVKVPATANDKDAQTDSTDTDFPDIIEFSTNANGNDVTFLSSEKDHVITDVTILPYNEHSNETEQIVGNDMFITDDNPSSEI